MAQVFNSDQNPPSVKWSQINTENFQVIYPIGFEKEAQRMASTIENLITKVSATLKKQPRKISIILQNQGTTANGFVQLAPRRSEFFTTPPQDGDFQDWLNSLAIHELRHVVQFDKLADGYRAPFFEGLALAIFGVTLPPWFYEGDAVIIETAMSNAGRGRMPNFDMAYRANLLSGKKYSYSKDYLGSVKDITPGYYPLGYFMNSKIRRDNGSDVLDSIFMRMRRNPIRPYNFSNSLKTYTGLNTRQLHSEVSVEIKGLWEQQMAKSGAREYAQLTLPAEKYPVSYFLPVRLPDGAVLVLKEGRQYISSLVSIRNGEEKLITKIGYQENPHFNYAEQVITWDEFRFDTRFQKRSFNVINTFNIETGEYRQVTHRTRYFSPALSPDARKIAVIDIDYANTVTLREIDAQTGEVLTSYPNPANIMLQMPRYNADGSRIIAVGLSAQGKNLVEYETVTKTATILMPFQQQNISRPVYMGQNVVYKAHYNGIENLYLFDRASKKSLELTSTRFGADNPSYDVSSGEILFNDYFSTGYRIASVKPAEVAPKDAFSTSTSVLNYSEPLIAQEKTGNAFDDIRLKEYPVKPYREFNNLFYFHTILPLLEDNEFTDDVNFGLELLSNNKLNTFDFYTGYEYNYGLRRHEYFAGFNYKRFYPVLGVEYTNRARQGFRRIGSGSTATFIPVDWREHYVTMGITVPVVLNQRNYNYSMNFKVNTELTSRYNIVNNFPNFIDRINFPMVYEYNFSRNSLRAAMDLAPRWGQNIKFTYHHLPFDDRLSGDKFTFQSFFYFPGLFKNHSLQAGFYYQNDSGIYDFDIDIPKVSGYSYLTQLTNQRNSLLLDYRFPIAYPDWELGPLAYIKRLKGGFFTDFANVGKGNPFTPASYGFELRADVNLLRFYLPNFDVGGRMIFMNKKSTQNPILEFTFSYSY